MIINLKNSKNLSTNDLRNSYQVQWWYIHEFYTDSLSFAVLSLVNSSLEQTHRGNIAYYLDNQYHTLKNVPSESEFLFGEVITPSKCKKKKKIASIPSNFWVLHSVRMRTKGTTLVNTRNLTATAITTVYIVNELNQEVQYFQGHNVRKNWYIKLVKKRK